MGEYLPLLNPIPAGPLTFLEIVKSNGLRLFKFFYFSNTNKCPSLLTFYTNCLSSQAYWLNALLYLYPTKSIFRPTYGHWVWIFYSSLESLQQKEADDCTFF